MGGLPMRRVAQGCCSLSAAVLLVSAALCGTAFGQANPGAKAPDPNLREVSLVRQDQSDCQNGNVSAADPSRIGGTAWVVRDGATTHVKVSITAQPKTTYHFFLKCVVILGDITTW